MLAVSDPPSAAAMTHQIRDFDWSKTPLGPIEDWPAELRDAVGHALDAWTPAALALDSQRFLSALGDELRPLLDADEIVGVASRRLGEALGLDRVVYSEIDVAGDHQAVFRDWNAPGMQSIVGVGTVSCLGPALVSHMTAGREVVIADLRADPLTAGEPHYRELDFRATICWPLIKRGRWVSALSVQSAAPREWRAAEVALVGEVADRTWDAIARAHAEIARRASEERYRTLFESIQEGFCACEALLDGAGEPYDYRFLEVNPAFTALTGLVAAEGHTMRGLVPDLDASWSEMFERVVRTGEAERLVRRTQDGTRWFDAHVARIDDAPPIRIAILISDVTDRQFAEGLLRTEKAVLEQIAAGLPLADTLAMLCEQIETLSLHGLRCSVSTDDSGVRLHPPAEIGPHDQRLVDHATRLAAVAIEHSRAEQAVRESEQRFRGFADSAPAMLAVSEPDGSCSFLSRGWYEFTGQTEATGLGSGWLDAVHPDDREASGERSSPPTPGACHSRSSTACAAPTASTAG
jgi:PAS domain S-box-containing protein